MKSYHNVIPFNAGERRQQCAQRLASQSAACGLWLHQDKWGRFYLSLPAEDIAAQNKITGTLDPCLVVCAATRAQIEDYLKPYLGGDHNVHQLLGVAEVYDKALAGFDGSAVSS